MEIRTIDSRYVLAIALLSVCCGKDSTPGEPWSVSDGVDAGSDVPPMTESCRGDSECAVNEMCAGPFACDAVWTCVPKEFTCSAAPPFAACGCDGVVQHFSAGCPGRYAWETGNNLTPANIHEQRAIIGCDPTVEMPTTFSIRAVFDALGLRDEALYVSFPPEAAPNGPLALAADTTSIDAELVIGPNTPLGIRAFVDLDGDGECGPADREVRSYVEETLDLDLEAFRATLRYRHVEIGDGERCATW